MAPTATQPARSIDCFAQAKIDATQPHPNRKKIFVFCDGTGNKFADRHGAEDANSNVVKLYVTLRVDNKQVAYYHPGVGTMGDPTIRLWLPRFWSKVKGLAFGAGFKANVLDAYRYLMTVYNDGDELYIFGFSRGAYTARALAGMLHGYGLLCEGNERHLEYVWNMFHDTVKASRRVLQHSALRRNYTEDGHSIRRNFAFSETYSRRVIVRFMGVWDTVSSVGWIYKPVRLLDMAQNPTIQVGRHAVSIDERRAFYRDNLWGPPVSINHKEWPESLREQGISQDMAQVWFPGAHSDVGGSYPQWESAPANESLKWMIGEVQRHGAELCQERIDMVLGTKSGHYAADSIFPPKPAEDWCLHESLDWKWWLLQCFPQQYYDKEDRQILWRVPYGTPRWIPHGAILHGSAIRRIDSPAERGDRYQPKNLVRAWCTPVDGSQLETSADFSGCFVYERPNLFTSVLRRTVIRYLRLVVGWTTFIVLGALLFSIAWYLLGFVVFLGLLLVTGLGHTPGIHHLFRRL